MLKYEAVDLSSFVAFSLSPNWQAARVHLIFHIKEYLVFIYEIYHFYAKYLE